MTRSVLTAPFLGVVLAVVMPRTAVGAGEVVLTTAIDAQRANSYRRAKLEDGSFRRETYAMANGGQFEGTLKAEFGGNRNFAFLAGTLAEHLARHGYFPASEAKDTSLLIVVHWGIASPPAGRGTEDVARVVNGGPTTITAVVPAPPPSGVNLHTAPNVPRGNSVSVTVSTGSIGLVANELQASERLRDPQMHRVARMLGYTRQLNDMDGTRRHIGGGATLFSDLVSELERPRFYIVVSAYDFKAAKAGDLSKVKPRWVTRFSSSAEDARFDEQLPLLIKHAAKYFGQDSQGLVRIFDQTALPTGNAAAPTAVAEKNPAK